MSIPATAIKRPVTMFMISSVIILLGVISLTRLPVDLLPDVSYPTVTVRVGYTGVGPLEMEQIVTRPIEQAVSAVAGLEQVNSTSQEGSSNIRLSFAWGTDLNVAMDDLRTRLDRVRGRLPIEADPPTIFRQDSNAQPIMSLGIAGNYDRVTLREIAENQLSPARARERRGLGDHRRRAPRRQIHVELSKEKIAALDLPVDRISALLRTENQNTPLGEVYQGERTYLLRSQAQFQSLDEIRNLVVMTRNGVPIYMRDVAEVKDTTEDVRSLLRINGEAGVRMQVQKQSGTNTVEISDAVRAEIDRINREMPNIKLAVLDDSAIYIKRSIGSVQEHAMLGSLLVTLIIFAFLRSFRSTLIVCTSIPDLGHRHLRAALFRRLHAEHHDVRRAGARHRHGRRCVDRRARERVPAHGARQGPRDRGHRRQRRSLVGHRGVDPDAHRRVRAAAVPDGHLEHPVPAAVGRRHLLAADVAAGRRHAGAGAVREPAEAAAAPRRAQGHRRQAVHRQREFSRRDGQRVPALPAQGARAHRPIVIGVGVVSVVAAVLIFPHLNTELAPQTDEGVVKVSAELASGTRIERTDAIMSRLEDSRCGNWCRNPSTMIASAGQGGAGGGGLVRHDQPRPDSDLPGAQGPAQTVERPDRD